MLYQRKYINSVPKSTTLGRPTEDAQCVCACALGVSHPAHTTIPFEMCGVTSSNATCNEALGIGIRATITLRVSNGANALIDLQVPKMSTGLITEDQQNRVPKAFI